MSDLLFPFATYWWFYAAFTAFVLLLLALDLGVFHRQAHEVSIREAATWSVVWVVLALGFNYGFYLYAVSAFGAAEGARLGLEFLTGYVVEKSLAVDNIFVFVMVFGYFAVPAKYQHRVLFYGIIGALLFRAVFIALGSVLMQYAVVVAVFGAFLILTGVKMMLVPDKGIDPSKNIVMRAFRRLVPVTTEMHGERFFVRIERRAPRHAAVRRAALHRAERHRVRRRLGAGHLRAHPEPLIVFTSNVFAILGLRAMYFLLAGMVDRFWALEVRPRRGARLRRPEDGVAERRVRRQVPDRVVARDHRRRHCRVGGGLARREAPARAGGRIPCPLSPSAAPHSGSASSRASSACSRSTSACSTARPTRSGSRRRWPGASSGCRSRWSSTWASTTGSGPSGRSSSSPAT